MSKQTPKSPPRAARRSNRTPSRPQPWLGWVAAALVGLILIVAIVLGVSRLNDGEERTGAEVQMTPIVGGMAVATPTDATGNGEPEVTVSAGQVVTVTMETTATEGVTATGAVTETDAATETVEGALPLVAVTETVTETGEVTATTVSTATAMPAETPVPTITPTATTTPTATNTATPTPSPTPTATYTPEPSPVYQVGELLTPVRGETTLYAEPDASALVLDTIGEGVTLTVLEPGGDYTAYPVEVAGYGWARVRAPDGLVGWARTLELAPVE